MGATSYYTLVTLVIICFTLYAAVSHDTNLLPSTSSVFPGVVHSALQRRNALIAKLLEVMYFCMEGIGK